MNQAITTVRFWSEVTSLVLVAFSLKLQVQNSDIIVTLIERLTLACLNKSAIQRFYITTVTFLYFFTFVLDILKHVEVPSQGDRLNFTLSVNAKDEIQLITRELNCYINGNLITNSSDILLTNDNKTLMTTVSYLITMNVRKCF